MTHLDDKAGRQIWRTLRHCGSFVSWVELDRVGFGSRAA